MTSICISGTGASLNTMRAGMQPAMDHLTFSSINTGTMSLPAPTGTLPNIADAGRIAIGAACRPVTLPTAANTLLNVVDAGRIAIGAACRPARHGSTLGLISNR